MKKKRRRPRLRTGARRSILLGTDPFTGEESRLPLDPREVRQYGMHVIGSPGKGKSKFLEWLIRNDILNGDGVCLIDPHGSLYRPLVRWCVANRIFRKRQVVLLDLEARDWAFGFNPLDFGTSDAGRVADSIAATTKAIAQVWGGEDLTQKPEISGSLPVLLHTLWANGLTLPDGVQLCQPGPFRDAAIAHVRDPAILAEWDYYGNTLTEADSTKRLWGARNRFRDFNMNPDMRLLLGQTKAVLDFRKAMDEQAVVLVNLGRLSEENKRTVGVLLQNDIFTKGILREPDRSPPFYVYLDECYYFVNEDTERILDGLRKFGVHLTLAHHRLSQLRKAGDSATEAVLQIPNKVVFGGLVAPDAEELVDYMFIDEIDYQESKDRFDKPTVVGQQRTWFHSFADGTGSSVSEGESSSVGTSTGAGTSLTLDPDGEELTSAESEQLAELESQVRSRVETETTTHTEGMSEGLESIFRLLPTIPYSLPEQIRRAMARLMSQHERHAVVKLANRRTASIYTPTVKEPLATERRARELAERNHREAGIALSRGEAEKAIEGRRSKLLKAAAVEEHPPEPDDWTE